MTIRIWIEKEELARTILLAAQFSELQIIILSLRQQEAQQYQHRTHLDLCK